MDSQKKNSIFAGILPSQQPEPAHAAGPAAPAPAPAPQQAARVSEEQLAAINRKIELMEKSIVDSIGRKISEQPPAPPPPPPPPSPVIPAVLSKIGEMETRFKEFQEKFMLGAAQMKNIEESKISARREIEELLKVVREQQKYSELDRQMHDQLEKAWRRVEEMEKRLVDAYAATADRPSERALRSEETAAAVAKSLGAALDEKLKLMETSLRASLARSAAEEREKTSASVSAALDAKLAAFASELQQLRVEAFAGKDRLEDLLGELKRSIAETVREAFDAGSAGLVRHVDAAALEGRERSDAMASMLVRHLDGLSGKVEGLSARESETGAAARAGAEAASAAKAAAEGSARASAAAGRELEELLKAGLAGTSEAILREVAAREERLRASLLGAAASAAAVSGASAGVAEAEERLKAAIAGMKEFVKLLGPVNLESVLGVSGALVRRSYESAGRLASELETEAAKLERIKGELSAGLRAASGAREGV